MTHTATIAAPVRHNVLQFRRVLVAVDSTSKNRDLFSYAADFVRRSDAEIHIVYCQTPRQRLEQSEGGLHLGSYRRQTLQELKELAADLGVPEQRTRIAFVSGRALDVLTSEIAEKHVDLVVLALSLLPATMALLAEELALAAHRPVIAWRDELHTAVPAAPHVSCVLAAAGLHGKNDPAVRYGLHLAELLGIRAEVVHAVDLVHDYSRPHAALDLQHACETLAHDAMLHKAKPTASLLYGEPIEAICARAKLINATLIVCGIANPGRPRRVNVPQMLVQTSNIPVMIVPYTDEEIREYLEA